VVFALLEPFRAEARAQVDVDLAKPAGAGVDEGVRLAGVRDDDVASTDLLPLAVDRKGRAQRVSCTRA
jgi:hypothetical protein